MCDGGDEGEQRDGVPVQRGAGSGGGGRRRKDGVRGGAGARSCDREDAGGEPREGEREGRGGGGRGREGAARPVGGDVVRAGQAAVESRVCRTGAGGSEEASQARVEADLRAVCVDDGDWLVKYRMAIIREEGSNGECEVVVKVAGLEPWDVHVRDLLNGRITLEGFLIKVLVGRSSYVYVLELVHMQSTVERGSLHPLMAQPCIMDWPVLIAISPDYS